jgi:poly-gamma-glutamate system protein
LKRVYWKPAGPGLGALAALAAVGIVLLFVVEHFPLEVRQDDFVQKAEAARRAQAAFSLLKQERLRRGIPIDLEIDPAQTGMIGQLGTEITTSTGNLASKRTSANPNIAGLVVQYFRRLGLERGDVVAVGCSGSFPGLNVAVLAAADTLGLEPLVISSVTSSDFGANVPSFMWPDMEQVLQAQGGWHVRSLAASVGGVEDQAIGLSASGQALAKAAIERTGVRELSPKSFDESLRLRMAVYDEAARGRPVAAYVNVGGGAVSVGRSRGKATYKPGINRPGPTPPVDSIIGRFLSRGVPVVHLTQIRTLAAESGLPVDPTRPQEVGTGELFRHREPNRWLAVFALGGYLGALYWVGLRARRRAHLATTPEGEAIDDRAHEARKRRA